MDSIPAETIASSIPFRFLVGPNQREFSIHSALLTHQSPVLERLVNGSFSEAAEKCVTWKSVDEGTFISFWQHTYTGKYTTDHPIIGLKPESEANREAEKKAVPEVERVAGEVEERAAQESIEAAAIAKEEEELAQLLEREANTFTGLSSRAGWRLKELQANAAGRVAREAEKRAAIAEEEQELAALLDKRHRRGKLVRKDNERIAHLQKKAAARGGETTSKELTKREAQWNVFKHQRDSASFGAFRSTDLFGGGLVRSNRNAMVLLD
ncbi:btb poz fold [Trichoderma arundinaceum]|uniref:Btb poz fold n=1 Tax=Trichoderma arundinaceum TaxID=490622 RepID=A0A395NA87_TRIAR|nr:btb poz fold [Trichoderma arundinaceum]